MDLSGPENIPQIGKQEQTMMWQQNQYMDSGIQSGATTQAPSVSSKHGPDDIDADGEANLDRSNLSMFEYDHSFNQGFTQVSV